MLVGRFIDITNMDETEKKALRAVVDYLWDDEWRDYNTAIKDGRLELDNHIFRHLMELESWLLHEADRVPATDEVKCICACGNEHMTAKQD